MVEEIRYEKLTWPQINEAVSAGKLILLPVGSIEDHAYHLPLDTDSLIVSEVCRRTASGCQGKVLVAPTVVYGYHPYRMDFPGGITLDWQTFTRVVEQITLNLAYHGFRKILIVNGHGSNHPLLQIAARQAIVEYPDVQCAMLSFWEIAEVQEVFTKLRESDYPGGASHACEFETSLYLALQPEHVNMDKAVKDISVPESRFFYTDLCPQKILKPALLSRCWSGGARCPTPARLEIRRKPPRKRGSRSSTRRCAD